MRFPMMKCSYAPVFVVVVVAVFDDDDSVSGKGKRQIPEAYENNTFTKSISVSSAK